MLTLYLGKDAPEDAALQPLHRHKATLRLQAAAESAERLRAEHVSAIATGSWWCALAGAGGDVCFYSIAGGFPFEAFRHKAPLVVLKASGDATRLAFIDGTGNAFVYSLGSSVCHRQARTAGIAHSF